jgi:hypothetical protein
MRRRNLKGPFVLSCCLLAAAAQAAPRPIYAPTNQAKTSLDKANLINHGGPVIFSAKVVLIFWGPSFNNAASADFSYARTLQAFRNQLGTTGEYRTVNQYGISAASLVGSQPDWFDTSMPPTNVTDSALRSKVSSYLSAHGGNNSSTVYAVFTPRTSYSSSGASTSCGGPTLAYCAYHSWIGSGSSATKYAIIPYPSCSGCQVSGWSDVQNAEHFLVQEVREAVTDPTGGTWFDSSGAEADDKCAWTPTPFIGTGGYAYQYEWSNLDSGCVKVK